MISRRNIRVKVMQTIYTLSTQGQEIKQGDLPKILQKHFDQSKDLLVYLTYFLTEVGRYAETDSYIRSSKHLPTAEDLKVNTKLAGNELLWKIKEDPGYQEEVKYTKPESIIDKELIRKIYQKLTETAEYKKYLSIPER